jgi:hypothetical protein
MEGFRVLDLDRSQTHARVWSCAPPPVAGRPDDVAWKGGRTVHIRNAGARRLGKPVRGSGQPYEPGKAGGRQGGGWQSGAAGEMPTARLTPAIGRKDERREKPVTDNRPAKVAMGGMSSYTAGPDCTAARHTDARSLAVPVPRGTKIPTAPAVASRDAADAAHHPTATIARGRPRGTMGIVYAPGYRMRIYFHTTLSTAYGVPGRTEIPTLLSPGRRARSRPKTAGIHHDAGGRQGCRTGAGGKFGLENFQVPADKPGSAGRPTRADR